MTDLDPNQLLEQAGFAGALLWIIRTVGMAVVEQMREIVKGLKVQDLQSTRIETKLDGVIQHHGITVNVRAQTEPNGK